MNSYPKMLYKPGKALKIDGHKYDYIIVNNEQEHASISEYICAEDVLKLHDELSSEPDNFPVKKEEVSVEEEVKSEDVQEEENKEESVEEEKVAKKRGRPAKK